MIFTEDAPFEGIKASGFGREGSHQGREECMEIKYVRSAAPRDASCLFGGLCTNGGGLFSLWLTQRPISG